MHRSPLSYQEKLAEREKIFSYSLKKFAHIKKKLQTDRFIYFGSADVNNAYLMSVGLYHRYFHLFEAISEKNGGSIRQTIGSLRNLAKGKGDIIEKMKAMMVKRNNLSKL